MIYRQFPRRGPLYVLAVPSWTDWISPFLDDGGQSGPNLVCWDAAAAPPTRLLASLDDTVILLSHHDTLLRDALFAHRNANILAQPEAVARLAHDKQRMAEVADGVPGLRPIPSFTEEEALDALASGAAGVVVKDRSGTEGKGFRVILDRDQLRPALDPAKQGRLLLQPALEGVEYSVNLICDGGACRVYAPVSKGSNRGFTSHPAKRTRTFPAPDGQAGSARLMSLAAAYAVKAGARGLLEVEFLETAEGVYLVEVNPRLSATLRMCITGSEENLLLTLRDIPRGGLTETRFVRPTAETVEIPLPPRTSRDAIGRLFGLGNVQISTRITLTAETADQLDDLRRQASRILQDAEAP